MDLEKLKKKLYRPEAEFEERIRGPNLGKELDGESSRRQQWDAGSAPRQESSGGLWRRFRWPIIAVAVFLFFAAGFMFWQGLTSFDEDKVELTIKGPQQASSGQEVVYKIFYRNGTRLDLENARLTFYYSKGVFDDDGSSRSFSLGEISSQREGEVSSAINILGTKGSAKKVRAELSYQPAGLSSRYFKESDFSTEITSVPLVLRFSLPEKVVSGQSFDFSLRYLNQSETTFDDLYLKLIYPQNFSFSSANPQPEEENDSLFKVGSLGSDEERSISASGSLSGEENKSMSFEAHLGIINEKEEFIAFSETADSLRISLPPLYLVQRLSNGQTSVSSGERLEYILKYKNTTDVGIRNVFIVSEVSGEALDVRSLSSRTGSLAGEAITWRPSNLPELSYVGPNQEGEVRFSVEVKESLPIYNAEDKHFTITNKARIDAAQVPASLVNIQISGESVSETKVKGKLTVNAQGFYQDETIINHGPIPPRAGQETSYTIKWQLLSSSNDLENVVVKAFLPPHSEWAGLAVPISERVNYDDQTGEIVWQVGDLPAGTGIVLPVRTVAFQVSIIPSQAQVGGSVELVGRTEIEGEDVFVGSKISSSDNSIDTRLPDDATIASREGIVVE